VSSDASDVSAAQTSRGQPTAERPDADAATLVDISALGGYSTDDILSGQYRCHVAATLTGRLLSHAIVGVNRFSTANAARPFGIHTVHFTTPSALRAELAELGLLPSQSTSPSR
jgi:hypothetical protein